MKIYPKRIISLVPSQTELLFDLGLEKEIVGITKFCVHPANAKRTKTIVGGTKHIKVEKIKALHPDIILCNKEENTKEIVMVCRKICTTHISEILTIEDAKDLIYYYGTIFNKKTKAQSLNDRIDICLREFQSFLVDKPKVTVAYFIWRNPWMVVANHTFINHILALNKFENVYLNLERYPAMTLKSIESNGKPQFVLLSSEPYPFKETHRLEIQKHFQTAKVILVDGKMFSWYGSRLIKSFDYFKTLRQQM